MELDTLRSEIDDIDAGILALFEKRMDVCAKIGALKRENNMPVLDSAREKAKLDSVAALSRKDLQKYTSSLFQKLFALSREYQESIK